MTINVLTGGPVPRLLNDIMRALVHGESDIQIEAGGVSIAQLRGHVRQHEIDVVIVACEPGNIDQFGKGLLEQARPTRVIAVTAKNCEAVVYSLIPVRHSLGRLSPQSLLSAIRQSGSSTEIAG